jgi:CcmD family protein
MTGLLDAGVAIYVAAAVALSVWIGIFVYLWRLDAQARALRQELERDRARPAEQHADQGAPQATVTRVSRPAPEAVEK